MGAVWVVSNSNPQMHHISTLRQTIQRKSLCEKLYDLHEQHALKCKNCSLRQTSVVASTTQNSNPFFWWCPDTDPK